MYYDYHIFPLDSPRNLIYLTLTEKKNPIKSTECQPKVFHNDLSPLGFK